MPLPEKRRECRCEVGWRWWREAREGSGWWGRRQHVSRPVAAIGCCSPLQSPLLQTRSLGFSCSDFPLDTAAAKAIAIPKTRRQRIRCGGRLQAPVLGVRLRRRIWLQSRGKALPGRELCLQQGSHRGRRGGKRGGRLRRVERLPRGPRRAAPRRPTRAAETALRSGRPPAASGSRKG